MKNLRVFPRHLQQIGLCLVPGARDWVARHGFSWREFVRFGLPAEELLTTGDAFAIRAVEQAKKEKVRV